MVRYLAINKIGNVYNLHKENDMLLTETLNATTGKELFSITYEDSTCYRLSLIHISEPTRPKR